MYKRQHHVVALVDSYRRRDATGIPWAALTDREIEHLYTSGLASIAIHSLESDRGDATEKSAQFLQAADLTARVIYAQMRKSTMEILNVANRYEIPIVLLKGISIAEDLYVEPHHRLMGDIDVLAPVEQAKHLQSLFGEYGYRVPIGPESTVLRDGHHHLPELRHEDSDIVVEVHTSLFSVHSLSDEPLFQLSPIWTHAEPATFQGIRCLKFRPEFQLMYTVAHWAIDQKWTVNVISFNDVVLILRANEQTMDWKLIASWLYENPLLAEQFAVILLFLKKASIIDVPIGVEEQVVKSARRIGVINMKILHWLILKFPLSDGRKNRSEITRIIVRVVWQTMLEPRHKSLRLIVSLTRILFRRTRDKSLLISTANRIRTFLQLVRRK